MKCCVVTIQLDSYPIWASSFSVVSLRTASFGTTDSASVFPAIWSASNCRAISGCFVAACASNQDIVSPLRPASGSDNVEKVRPVGWGKDTTTLTCMLSAFPFIPFLHVEENKAFSSFCMFSSSGTTVDGGTLLFGHSISEEIILPVVSTYSQQITSGRCLSQLGSTDRRVKKSPCSFETRRLSSKNLPCRNWCPLRVCHIL